MHAESEWFSFNGPGLELASHVEKAKLPHGLRMEWYNIHALCVNSAIVVADGPGLGQLS